MIPKMTTTETVPLKGAKARFLIYALRDDRMVVRYVGITRKSLMERLRGHIKSARDRKKHRTHRDNWIRHVSYAVGICLLEKTRDSKREGFWISRFRALGMPLTNLTDGGEGITGYRHTEEAKLAMSISRRGKPKPESARPFYQEAARKRFRDNPGEKKRMSELLMGHEVTKDTRKRIGDARNSLVASGWVHPCTGRKHSEERRKKNSDAQLKRYANGAVSPRLGFIVSEETRIKLREAAARRRKS